MSPPRPLLPKDSGRFFVTVTLDFSHAAVTGQRFIARLRLGSENGTRSNPLCSSASLKAIQHRVHASLL